MKPLLLSLLLLCACSSEPSSNLRTVPYTINNQEHECAIDSGATGYLWIAPSLCSALRDCYTTTAGNQICKCDSPVADVWDVLDDEAPVDCLLGAEYSNQFLADVPWQTTKGADGKLYVDVVVDESKLSCFLDTGSSSYITVADSMCPDRYSCEDWAGSKICHCKRMASIANEPAELKSIDTWSVLYSGDCIVGMQALEGYLR